MSAGPARTFKAHAPPSGAVFRAGLLSRLLGWFRRRLKRPAPEAPAPPPLTARNGQALRSRGELLIANWLDDHGFAWEYEPKVAGFTPDFVLREERVIVEYWGMKGRSRRYDEKIREKKRRYRKQGWQVVGVEPKHLKNLDGRLGDRLRRP